MRTNNGRVRGLVIGVLLAGMSSAASAQTVYRLEDLGQLDGVGSFPTGINNSGQAAGWLTDSTHTVRAVRSVEDVFQLVPGIEPLVVEVDGINQFGDLAGALFLSTFPVNAHAVRFTDGGGLEDLGTLGGNEAIGTGINSSGQVVGWSLTQFGQQAFIANPGQPMAALAASYAGGINDAGQVSGYDGSPQGPSRAFVYTPGTGIQYLTAAGVYSAAEGINNLGQIAGSIGTASGQIHAARYTPGTGFVDLDPVATRSSQGWDINENGDVVGNFRTALLNHAFVYTAAEGFVDLNTRIVSGGTGWTLVAATGINSAGEIVGTGQFQNQGPPRGFKLVPADLVPPAISSVTAAPAVILDRDGRMVPVQISVSVTDNVDPSPDCSVTALVDSAGIAGDAVITGPLRISVRGKRTGSGGVSRIYTATVTCTDAQGNSATGTATVTVAHDSSSKE